MSVTAALPVSPANGTQISFYSQPVTVVAASAVATGGASPSGVVEVATDATFATTVATQNVVAAANRQVSAVLPPLAAGTTYYWRTKTAVANNPGVLSPALSFTIGPRLTLQPPIPVRPLPDAFEGPRPVFVVTNAARTGPAATLLYRFEVATDAAGTAVVASGAVPEGTSQTSFTPSVDLSSGVTFFWRAQAYDRVTSVTSAFSSPQQFATVSPADGVWPYRFVLQTPAICQQQYPVLISNGELSGAFSFDGNLRVAHDALTFGLGPGAGDLSISLARTGDKLSGTAQTGARLPRVLDAVHQIRIAEPRLGVTATGPARIVGMTSPSGRLSGTLNGVVSVSNLNADFGAYCITDFAWTLTPIF